MNKNKLLLSNEEGSIAILVAFLLTIFIGFMGLAVDFGYAYLQKTRLQKVADAEALACVISPASAPCPANGTNLYPELNPYGFTVTTVNPGDNSLCLNPAKQTKCARATAQVTWNTFFINLFGVNTLNLSATALAAKTGEVPSCIVTTANFSANGNDVIKLNNCAVSVGGNLSSSRQTGIEISGPGNITVFNGNSPSGCPACKPEPVSVQGPIPNIPTPAFPTQNIDGSPLPTLPYTSCTVSSCIPAIYTGGQVNLNQATTLASGYYIFSNGFDNKGNTLTSAPGGVGIYVPGNMPLVLSGTVNLTAPSITGCTVGSGVVLSHPDSPPSQPPTFKLNGSKDRLSLTGVVNLSADNILVDGGSVAISIVGSLIARSIDLRGNMNPQASSNPCFNLYESSGKPVLID